MSSKKRNGNSRKDVKEIEKTANAHDSTADSAASDAPNLPLSALTNDDPCALTAIFEPSKIKNFLYKAEPKMGRISASSLDLISTTATVLLKTLVEKTVLLEQEDRMWKTTRSNHHSSNGTKDNDLQVNDKHILITSNRLKSVLESASGPSALDFLEETYENFRDKDGSFLPSKLSEYIPRTAQKRKAKSTNKVAKSKTTSKQANVRKAESADNESKKVKRNHTYKGTSSSLLFSSEGGNDAGPVEKAIAQAVATTENHAPYKIVEDEDDYD